MGRDMTSREHHLIDKRYGFSKVKTAFTETSTGKEHVLYDPSSKEAVRWPNACFLAQEVIRDLTERQKDLFEEALCEIVDAEDNARTPDLKDPGKEQLLDTVLQWYDGCLDSDFYYNMENNRILKEYLKGLQ